MLKKINTLWLNLIGDRLEFPLESRIFHSISLACIVLGLVYIPYNFFEGLLIGSFSALLLASFFFWQYYRSRFQGKMHSSVLFGLTGLVVFGFNYFANSGINGSTDLIWPGYLLLLLTVSPYRQHVYWVVAYLLSFLALHWVAYQYPYLVKHPFAPGKGELIDRVTAFPLPVIIMFIVIKYLRKNYDGERAVTEEKTLAIEANNRQILLQKNQLEQSDTEKNKLMSIISHDMRAPLVHIQGYLELINADVIESHERPALERELLAATNNTLDMLTNLLQWSKSQMEGPSLHLVSVNLLSAIQNTLEMGKTQSVKKNITFSYLVDDSITVVADPDMLQLVVRNLISNAIKFTPTGGTISINTQLVGRECKLTVSDNGKGIDLQKQQKIFSVNTEPGFGTNNEKGVGLGLLLCKEFIERQGGRIGFESIFGQGSSFFIYIPVA